MKNTIEKILLTSSHMSLNQAVYLWAVRFECNLPNILPLELKELVEMNYIKGQKVTNECLRFLDSLENTLNTYVDESYPILTKSSGDGVKRLAVHFLKDNLNAKEFNRILDYTKKPLQVPFLYIFMEMFPTSDNAKNSDWNSHFDTKWDNVTLRKLSVGTVKKFQTIWKKKDIGIFLLGTYMFIKESYNESSGKYYIKSIENYMAEYDHWYNVAEESMANGDLGLAKKKVTQDSNTTFL